LIEDNGRFLFLEKRYGEVTAYALPCVIARESDDPVTTLANAVKKQTGIDAYITTVALTGTHNAGSRKRKQFLTALAFKASSKSFKATVACKWLTLQQATGLKLDRASEWLRTALTLQPAMKKS
jgi:hypothetical protein